MKPIDDIEHGIMLHALWLVVFEQAKREGWESVRDELYDDNPLWRYDIVNVVDAIVRVDERRGMWR